MTERLKTDKELRRSLAAYMNSHQDDSFTSIAVAFGLSEADVQEFSIDWAMGLV